jgi:hypothetical protein
MKMDELLRQEIRAIVWREHEKRCRAERSRFTNAAVDLYRSAYARFNTLRARWWEIEEALQRRWAGQR